MKMKYILPALCCIFLGSFRTATSQIPEYYNHVDQVLWVVDDLTNTIKHWANLGFTRLWILAP